MKSQPFSTAALLLLLAIAATAETGATTPLDVTLHYRALAPGEPVRIVVESHAPLRELRGEFDETATSFTKESPTRWIGWGMLPLDAEPGLRGLELSGTTEAGDAALGTLAFRVVEKAFPEEHLKVPPRYVDPGPKNRERIAREKKRLGEIYALRTAPQKEKEDGKPFARPVSGKPTSIFGARRYFNGELRSPHPGLDLRARTGTAVVASGPGKVVLAEDLYYAGQTVILDHGGGLFTIYAHLSKIGVEEGQEIARGETVGASGATGRVTGPHLHWGAKIGDRPFDPRALLDPRLFGESTR